MKGLLAVLSCTLLATALVACGQDKGKAPTETQKKQVQKKDAQKKQAQKKQQGKGAAQSAKQKAQQDRTADCNKQANLKMMRGEDRKRFMSSCVGR
jgi:hypothetical protein